MSEVKKVVLAYSGGLDTSIIIPWLKEHYNNCEVIAVCGNVGQKGELEGLEERAKASGASKLYIEDLTDEFVEDYVIPTMQAGADYEGYLLGTSFARPILAKRVVEIARAEGADAVCHGSTGKGNDQVRFELAIMHFAPDLKIITPWREWDIQSRDEEIDYAEAHHIPLKLNRETNYSKDKNLWHLSHEGLDLEDPGNEPQYDKPGFLELGVSPKTALDKSEFVELEFEVRGQRCTVRRNPEYLRPKARGEGFTTEKADSCLTYADGRPPVTRAKDVTAAVVDIIGLDYNQFSQIAMIAQGQFTRLLNASTEERSKIFRKLFRTQPYQRLQERLQAENAALTRQREEQSVRIGQLLSGLSWAEGDADGAVLDKLAPLCEAGGQASPEAVLPLLDALLAGQEQALSAAASARPEAPGKSITPAVPTAMRSSALTSPAMSASMPYCSSSSSALSRPAFSIGTRNWRMMRPWSSS